MRALPVAVIAATLSASCAPEVARVGVDVFAIALDAHLKPDPNRPETRPKPPLPIALDSRGADGMLVGNERFTFIVPADWRARGPNGFIDAAERHAVAIAAYDKALEPDAWVRAYFPDAKTWPGTIDGRTVVFVVGARQVTTLVIASATELFELTCAQSDVSKAVPNAVCSDVFNSFRLR